MHKFLFISILNLSQIVFVFGAGEDPDSGPLLPLVFVKYDGRLQYPNEIKKVFDEPEFAITGDVKFSRNGYGHQVFFCPANAKEKKLIQDANKLLEDSRKAQLYYGQPTVSDSCLFKRPFKSKEVVKCAREASPRIYPVQVDPPRENRQRSCGPNNVGRLYRFVYEVCLERKYLEKLDLFLRYRKVDSIRKFNTKFPYNYERKMVYEICYNVSQEETMFTRHELPSMDLLTDENLYRERLKTYPLSTSIHGRTEFFFERKKFFYEKHLDEINSNEIEFPFKPQFFVPPDDMLTDLLRRSTFHYINTGPMHEDLVKLWDYIGELIRKNLHDSNIPYQVYTTATKHSTHSKGFGIADIWIKVIYLPHMTYRYSPSLAVVMKNLSDNPQEGNILDHFCSQDHCTSFKKKDEVSRKFSFYLERVRCCPLNENIEKAFPITLNKGFLLHVSNLTDIVRSPSLVVLNEDKSK